MTCVLSAINSASPNCAPFFEVSSRPIPAGELEDPDAKGGCVVSVTVKPGLPLGPVQQTIRLQLQSSGSSETFEEQLGVEGSVDADISIVGAGWNSDHARLSIGTVKSASRRTRNLIVLVRGEHRDEVTIKPVESDPAWLQVKVGEASELKNRNVKQIPLTIVIPPNMQPLNRMGSDQGPLAEILLETTHPKVKSFRVYVQFLIGE